MRAAIIGGTGIDKIPGGKFQEEIMDTQYGKARVFFGKEQYEDLIFPGPAWGGSSYPPA